MGVLHRWDGRMGDWVDDGKFLCSLFFPLLLMTWQWICARCLLLAIPHVQVLSAGLNPTLILYLKRSTLCFQ